MVDKPTLEKVHFFNQLLKNLDKLPLDALQLINSFAMGYRFHAEKDNENKD